ncbi:MAG: hypothetical protein RI575_16795 [Balneolaceae bacterium]|nr:hypothetical protein [Balneolaceae bacterium]
MNNYSQKRKIHIPKLLMTVCISLALSLGVFMACEGPEGPEGPAGEQGPEGPVGPAGEDGSMILAGTGAPSSDTGSIGDYYLDSDNAELYGPKVESGWGTPLSLQGPPGADGSQIHSGTSAPDAGMGQRGDYFLNTSTFDLYGPKTESGWGTPINLKGTANVMYSEWVNPQQWEEGTFNATKYRYFDILANAMTQDILDNGVVKVYTNLNTQSIYSLPIGKGDTPANSNYSFFFELKPQQLRIGYINPDNSTTLPMALNTNIDFRYVLIPGEESLAKRKAKSLPIDLNNYQEVKKYFGIRD